MEYTSSMGEEEIIPEEESATKYNPRVVRAKRELQLSFNPEADRVIASQQYI